MYVQGRDVKVLFYTVEILPSVNGVFRMSHCCPSIMCSSKLLVRKTGAAALGSSEELGFILMT